MSVNELKALFNSLNFYPSKKLGQNFLVCNHILQLFLNQGNIQDSDVVLEVGPGFGFITEKLIQQAKKVIAIELDKRLSSFLRIKFATAKNFELITGDALKVEIPPFNKVIANIPYTITGPLFEKLFYNENPPIGVITTETMIADRIFDYSNYKKLSRISISVNTFMKPVFRKQMRSDCFYPQPKIEISLIKLEPNQNLPDFLLSEEQRQFFLNFLGGVFPYKNKNIVNAIKLYLKKENYTFQDIDTFEIEIKNRFLDKVRLKDLEISDFLATCKMIYNKIFEK